MVKFLKLKFLNLAFVFWYLSGVHSLSVNLQRNSPPQCFVVHASTGTTVTGSFEIISGDPNSVHVTVFSPKELKFESKFRSGVDSEKDLSEGSFSFDAETPGDHTMCIANNKEVGNDGTERTVAFNIRSLETAESGDYEYVGLESELEELREGLTRLIDHQSFMNQREDVHRTSLDDINLKVLCWTILEAVILVAMAVWQIAYIRGFFEVKRRL